ncbi:3998_t:CDS:1 [Diversispora eburnea]|uniref:3998_t:CDS:1 n=1 Tax=Diversispora eburnea TaxID=1213867 RepID=A0A9N9B1G7_9GLOM|nr:3998_t:CDS:1 [Diversispora eburnea]
MDKSISKNPGAFSESDRLGKLHQVLHMTINEMTDKALRPMKDGTLKSFFKNPHDYLNSFQYFLNVSRYSLPKLPEYLQNDAYRKQKDLYGCQQIADYLNNIMMKIGELMKENEGKKQWIPVYREFFYQALIATSKAKVIEQLLGFRYHDRELEIYKEHLNNTISALEDITFVLVQLFANGFVDGRNHNIKDLKEADYEKLYIKYQ